MVWYQFLVHFSERPVKLVIAIIQPPKLRPVQEALARIGVERMTVCDAQGYGRQRGRTAMYRGVEYRTNLLRRTKEKDPGKI